MLDFLIIGAGVVGGFVARELTKYKLSVTIVDAAGDVAMGATRANSAIVHAGFDAKAGSLKARLNVRGSEMMEATALELGVKYKRNGALVVGFDEDDERTLASLLERGEKNGVKGLRILKRDEILKMEENIGDGVTAALYAPTSAIVCPYELCIAAVGNAMDNGARLRLGFKVAEILAEGGGYTAVSDKGEKISARFVINCAGTHSDEIAAMVGDTSFTVRARRGEYTLFDKECGSLVGTTVFRCPTAMGKGVLVTPTVDGNLLIGPSAEDIDDKDDTKNTASALISVRNRAMEQVKGIDTRKAITTFAGLRATGSTGDFIINHNGRGFINCAGIESPGLTSAPAIAEYVVDMLTEMGVRLEINPSFNPVRKPSHWFSLLDNDGKNEVIKEHPEYARIICRCEVITEGEILEAIRTNPRPTDLDGVKRRTRATMGRCQGGFCSPYIVELLAREMQVDFTDVTKLGGGSYINVGRTKEIKE